MRGLLRCVAVLIAAWGCSAGAAPCPPASTWRGTLGGEPLMLNLSSDYGAYYLGTSLHDVLLQPVDGQPQRWHALDEKGKRLGELRLDCSGQQMQGERIALDGRRTPLVAEPAPLHEPPAPSPYNARRLAAVPVVPLKRLAAPGGRSVEVVAVRGYEQLPVLRIVGARGGELRVNEQLRAALVRQLDDHMACQTLLRATGRFDDPGGNEVTARLAVWRGTLFSVRYWSTGYCGGAHPYEGADQAAYDTVTGQLLPPEEWLAPAYREGIALDTPLGQRIERMVLAGKASVEDLPEQDRDCAEDMLRQQAKVVGVEDKGLAVGFSFPHAGIACYQEFLLPWNRLGPYLSAEGRRRLRLMRSGPPA